MSSPNIKFDNINTDTRKPGQYSEYDLTTAVAALPSGAPKVAILGQKTADGSATADTPYKIFSEQDSIDRGGTGSIIHLAARAALKAFPNIDCTIVPIDDAAGTAATGTIVIANAATASGTIDFWIGNEYVQVTVTSGDSANTIAAAVDTAINAKEHNMPVTASVNLATVTLTARNDGLLGNNIPCSYKINGVTATTVTITQVGSVIAGATDPSIANALAAIAPEKYDIIICTLNDATNLGLLKTHLATYAAPTENKPGVGIFGYTGVQATCETLCGTTLNSGRISCAYMKYSKTTERGHSLDYEVGAAYGAVIASHDDPAAPYNYEALTGIAPSDTAQRLTRSQQESTLENGVTPLEVGAGETVQIVRAITTYTTNASSILDPSQLDLTTIRSLDYGRLAIETRQALRFARSKATERTKDKLKAEVLDVIRQLSELEIWNNVTPDDEVLVEADSVAAGRFNVSIPAHVVQGLHIIANKISLFLG